VLGGGSYRKAAWLSVDELAAYHWALDHLEYAKGGR